MPKSLPALNTAQTNLRGIIERSGQSVNAWAISKKLDQSTISRIISGKQDMTSAKMEQIAQAAGFPAWHLLVEGYQPSNPPMLRAETEAERKLYAKIQQDIQELTQLRERNTKAGTL